MPAEAASKFAEGITAAKSAGTFGAAVYVYPVEEYANMRMFLADDGKTGFALKGDDIVSVFSGTPGSVDAMLQLAIQEGGRKLDAFDTVLPDLYARHGMKIVSRMSWNDEYAPEGWDKKTFAEFNGGEPDVVFMVYDPNYYGKPAKSDGIRTDNYDEAVAAQEETKQADNKSAFSLPPTNTSSPFKPHYLNLKKLRNATVSERVKIADTGEVATIETDPAEQLAEFDQRLADLQKVRACI